MVSMGMEWSVCQETFKFKIQKHPRVNCTERSVIVWICAAPWDVPQGGKVKLESLQSCQSSFRLYKSNYQAGISHVEYRMHIGLSSCHFLGLYLGRLQKRFWNYYACEEETINYNKSATLRMQRIDKDKLYVHGWRAVGSYYFCYPVFVVSFFLWVRIVFRSLLTEKHVVKRFLQLMRNLFSAYDVWDINEVHVNISLRYIFRESECQQWRMIHVNDVIRSWRFCSHPSSRLKIGASYLVWFAMYCFLVEVCFTSSRKRPYNSFKHVLLAL